MGWSGPMPNAEGRMVGYAVEAICDSWGCEEKIDHGLAYVCGGMHDGDEHGCGKYFCGHHLFFGEPTQLCRGCLERYEQRQAFEAGWRAGRDGDEKYMEIAYDKWYEARD